MILETSINGWNNKIVQHKQITYPQTLDENTPKNFFWVYFVDLVEVVKLIY